MQRSQSIVYFEREGRENLSQVLRVVKSALRKRADLRSCKVVVFTAIGEGPALAYNLLQEFDPEIIAVTFPSDFFVVRDGKRFYPRIPEKIQALFNGLNIKVISTRLPFDDLENVTIHNEQMKLIKNVITLFGGGFVQCIQAVLQACDHNAVQVGERVISVTGDSAAIMTASTTKAFLSKGTGLVINEILCKARNFTIARGGAEKGPQPAASLFETNAALKVGIKKELPALEGKVIDAKK